MNKFILFIYILFFYTSALLAQISQLNINVLSKADSTNIPNAFIKIIDLDTLLITNKNGLATINNVNANSLNLIIYKQGFITFYTTVSISPLATNTYLVFLEKDVFNKNFTNINSFTYFNQNNNFELVNKNLSLFNFADYFNLKNSFYVNNYNYSLDFYNRNIKNNFYITINNIIIPQAIYSDFLPFLNLNDNYYLIFSNSPNNYASGGTFFINNINTNNNVNIKFKYFTQQANQLLLNTSYNFKHPIKNIDSISVSANYNLSNPYKYNNYYKTYNSNVLLSTKLYTKNNFYNELNIIYNSYYFKDTSPKLFLSTNDYKNSSNFMAFSLVNSLPITNRFNIQLINNYSIVNKTFNFYNSLNNKLTLFNTKLLLQYLLQNNFKINFTLENDFTKLNYYNLPNSLITKNALKTFANVEYLLNFGTLTADFGITSLKPNTYYNINAKIKIYTSINSNFILGYGVVHNLLSPYETTLAQYDINGIIIGTYFYPLPPIKIYTTEAVFNYTDNKIYNLTISLYSDYIKNLHNGIIHPFNTSIKVDQNKYSINTINFNLKLIPVNKVYITLDYYNISLLTDDNIPQSTNIPQNGLIAIINYNPHLNTNILLRLRNFWETLIGLDNHLDYNFFDRSKPYIISSTQFVDIILTQTIKNFDLTLGVYNIFDNNKITYKNITPLNIYFCASYTIK